jgi:hypothetical protein
MEMENYLILNNVSFSSLIVKIPSEYPPLPEYSSLIPSDAPHNYTLYLPLLK